MKTKKGFTLVELLIVIAIMAIMLALFVPAVYQAMGSSSRYYVIEVLDKNGAVVRTYESRWCMTNHINVRTYNEAGEEVLITDNAIVTTKYKK